MENIKVNISLVGSEHDIKSTLNLLKHIEYLGNVGASRNILVRVDGDGNGRIKVFKEVLLNGNRLNKDNYNTDQEVKSIAIVGTYDIGY